ncbi:uncharacterized protein LOC119989935 [Tripterygium wilfordii]|uniref:uncharacterized protein LOC119989935 n=1 Tax=Tripterygium wilfordii TaxID=458696 RepID=UPI0018F810D3|nr:uncharacterized protein LOC119989935 [Tripterygium wilfordii]
MDNSSIDHVLKLLLSLVLLIAPGQIRAVEFQPIGPVEYRVIEAKADGTQQRRRLAPYQLCLVCKCCAGIGVATTCATMPCCFGIDCELPNKPYGVCAFVPKSCNCTSCAV